MKKNFKWILAAVAAFTFAGCAWLTGNHFYGEWESEKSFRIEDAATGNIDLYELDLEFEDCDKNDVSNVIFTMKNKTLNVEARYTGLYTNTGKKNVTVKIKYLDKDCTWSARRDGSKLLLDAPELSSEEIKFHRD